MCECVFKRESVCERERGLAGRLLVNVGERALLSERGSAEWSAAKISYNLHSPAIFPPEGMGEGRRGRQIDVGGGEEGRGGVDAKVI